MYALLFPGVENVFSNNNVFEMMDGKGITMIEDSDSDDELKEGNKKNYTFIN